WRDGGGLFDAGELTLSLQHHDEERDRLRTRRRRDLQGFSLDDLGALGRIESESAVGRISWGFEAHHERVSSFRKNFKAGVFTGANVQGPVGDDASYDTVAAYVQDEVDAGDGFHLVPGVRATHARLHANRVANPKASGPKVIGISDDWNAVVGSVRALYDLTEESRLFAGVSQGFRAPSLSDETSFNTTSVVERPSPGLDPERFIQFEIGSKGRTPEFEWQTSLFHTLIRNLIVQSPNGKFVGATPVVRKDSIGDGWVQGAEAALNWHVDSDWSVFGATSWTNGEVDQIFFPASGRGRRVRAPLSRLAPFQGTAGVRWQPEDRTWWIEGSAWAVNNQDRLALRDRTDTTRIPPGGTPGFTLFDVAAGWTVGPRTRMTLSIQNLGDRDYRVHGSGLNGPGRNLVITVEVRF
ncbi:MAG: TonB-dependent receptor, partial [Planctomycetota bacterium]